VSTREDRPNRFAWLLDCFDEELSEDERRLDRALAFFDHIIWYGRPPDEEFCGIVGAM
jgi:hypothetical protein